MGNPKRFSEGGSSLAPILIDASEVYGLLRKQKGSVTAVARCFPT